MSQLRDRESRLWDAAVRQLPPDVKRILDSIERRERFWRRLRWAIFAAIAIGAMLYVAGSSWR